jgi:hypothetical protein
MEISDAKWKLVKDTIEMLFAQHSLLASLVIVAREHGIILRELATKLDYEVPPLATLAVEVDPEVLRRMAQGLLELEKMINAEDPNPERSN